MTDKEVMQMALHAMHSAREFLATVEDHRARLQETRLHDAMREVRAALAQGDTEAEQPSELVQILDKKLAWVDLQKEAQKIVESKFLWKRFIDGTPLSNDISCWMADFAEQCTAPQQREWHPLTDEEISKCLGATATSGDTLQLISAIAAALKEKNHD